VGVELGVGLGRFELPTVRSPAGGYEPDALTELLAIHALSYRPSLSGKRAGFKQFYGKLIRV